MDLRISEWIGKDLFIFKFNFLGTADSDYSFLLREKVVGGEEDDPLRRVGSELVLL